MGAGPTGLTLANCLHSYGVPFTLIERKTGPSADSKALAINVASQLSFALLGLPDSVGRHAQRVRRLQVSYRGARLCRVDFARLGLPSSCLRTQPQAVTERELIESLPEARLIRWGQQLTSLRQSSHGVTARIGDDRGREYDAEFCYVVGCDGKNSVVRKAMNVSFEGRDYPMHFVLGDFELNWNEPADTAHYLVFDDTFFVIAPVAPGRWRVVVKHNGPAGSSSPSVEQVILPVEARLGSGLFKRDAGCSWLSRAPFYQRTASALREGRLFLAGDSAHLFSPIGGTGMNTGMQDAFNLAWKLAHAWRGHPAQQELLDSYDAERHEAIQATAAATDTSTRLIARLDSDARLFEGLLPRMSNRANLRSVLPLAHSGLGMRYTRSAMLALECSGSPPVGTLFADMPVIADALAAQHAAPREPLATRVLAIGTADMLARDAVPSSANLTAALAFAIAAEKYRAHLVRPALVVLDRDKASAPVPVIGAARLELRSRRELEAGRLLVVRPDGLVAWSSPLSETSSALRFLARRHSDHRERKGPFGQSPLRGGQNSL